MAMSKEELEMMSDFHASHTGGDPCAIPVAGDYLQDRSRTLYDLLEWAFVSRPPPEFHDARLAATEYVVQATHEEMLWLWSENDLRQSLGSGNDLPTRLRHLTGRHVTWEEDSRGLVTQIGLMMGRPISLTLIWARLNGRLVMFWHACGDLVDYELARRWLGENCPVCRQNGRTCDAMNFHNCLGYCLGD